MTDRLTQLQVCLDQIVAQFNSTINYANTQSELALLDPNPSSVINLAASAPLPGKKEADGDKPDTANGAADDSATAATTTSQAKQPDFDEVINELSTDIILKSRQISMIIDSLPGIGTLPETQLEMISELMGELEETEKERVEKMKEKDVLLKWCEDLIVEVSEGIYHTRT
ncbi:hypothetical protein JCM33374_g3302 [Metschnikowia sp. JCM 33374]|nr:hypothetical protein JCM33374_g3302 [Metschnikowia sp. JCM 33374]